MGSAAFWKVVGDFFYAVFFGTAAGAAPSYVFAVNVARLAIVALTAKLTQPDLDFTNTAKGKGVTIRDSIAAQKFIYGQDQISGPIIYANTAGDDNKDLYYCIALAGHECDSVTHYRIDDTNILLSEVSGAEDGLVDGVTNKFEDVMEIEILHGESTQAVSTLLSTAFPTLWTSSHTLRGWCTVVFKMTIDTINEEAYKTGVPRNFRVRVKGRFLYDPRLDTTNGGAGPHRLATPSTWEWSENPALALADWIRDDKFGLDEEDDRIDWPMVITAANICEQAVTIPTGTHDRYTINATFSASQRRMEVRDQLVNAMMGRMVFSQGLWKMWAGAAVTADVTLTEANLAGDLQVQATSGSKDRYNRVRGKFVDSSRDYVPSSYPEVRSTTFETADNSEATYKVADFTTVQNTFEAQRDAIILLKKSRQMQVISWNGNFSCFRIQPGSVVDITVDELGLAGSKFFVTEWKFGEKGIELTLVEEADSVWADPASPGDYTTRTPTGTLTFADIGVPPPTALTAVPVVGGVLVCWTNPPETLFKYIEVWMAFENVRGSATRIGNSEVECFYDLSRDVNRLRYYWVRAVNEVGTPSVFLPDLTTTTITSFSGEPQPPVTKDPLIRLGTAVWGLTCSGASCVVPTYVADVGTKGTDVINFAGSAIQQRAFHKVRRGPDEWDVEAVQSMALEVRYRVKYSVAGTGGWTVTAAPQIFTSDASELNIRSYNGGIAALVTFDENSTVGVWEERVFVVELAQEDLETPPRYIHILMFMDGNNNGAEYQMDMLEATIVGRIFDGESKAGFVPAPSAAQAAAQDVLAADATWIANAAGGGNPFATPLGILGDIVTATPPVAELITAILDFSDLDDTDLIAQVGFAATNTFRVKNLMHGGSVQLEAQTAAGLDRVMFEGVPGGISVMYYDDHPTIEATLPGELSILGDQNLDADVRAMFLKHADGTLRATIGHENSATLIFKNEINTGPVQLVSLSGIGGDNITFQGDPVGKASLYNAGLEAARTLAAGAGGFEANNTLTGAGFERVLTASDLVGVGGPFATSLGILGDINTATPPVAEAITAILDFSDLADDDLIAQVGFIGSNILRFKNLMHGGTVQLEGQTAAGLDRVMFEAVPGGISVMYHDDHPTIEATLPGELSIYGDQNLDADVRAIFLKHADGTLRATIGHENTSTLIFKSEINTGPVQINSLSGVGADRIMFQGDPVGKASLYDAGTEVARTLATASGGFEANNTATGAGFERVLTVSDLTGIGSPFPTPLGILGDINTATPPVAEAITAILDFSDLADNDLIAQLGFTGSNILRLKNLMHGGKVQLEGQNGAGTDRVMFEATPGGTSVMYYDDHPTIEATLPGELSILGDQNLDADVRALFLKHADGTLRATIGHENSATLLFKSEINTGPVQLVSLSGVGGDRIMFQGDPVGKASLYNAGTEVARTLAIASGGFEANNTLTGAGFERVLTTSDLGAGPLAGLSDVDTAGVVTGSMLFKANGNWEDTGAKLTWNPAGETLRIVDSASTDHMELEANSTNCNFLSNVNPFFFFPEGIGAAVFSIDTNRVTVLGGKDFRLNALSNLDWMNVEHDGTNVVFTHVDTTDWRISSLTRIRLDGVIQLQERSTAPSDTSLYGQFWVRNDAPGQTPMFTDDAGVDNDLTAIGGSAVDSVFGRTGAVVALTGDYSAFYTRPGDAENITALWNFQAGLQLDDNDELQFGNLGGGDADMRFTGTVFQLRMGTDVFIETTPNADVALFRNGVEEFHTQDHSGTDNITGAEVKHWDGNFYDVGMARMPKVNFTSGFTATDTHWHKRLVHNGSGSITISFNTESSQPQDVVLWILAKNGTVVIGGSAAKHLYDGSGGVPPTGSITIARAGWATVVKDADAVLHVTGVGLTS